MQVVNFLHAGILFQGLGHFIEVDVFGRGLHEDVGRLTHETPTADDNEDGDDRAGQRIKPIPALEIDGHAGGDGGHGPQGVGQEVQKGAFQVDAAILGGIENDHSEEID